MKKVYSSNSEMIHVWANHDSPEFFLRANSVSCQYNTLFSYRTAIAQIVGDTVILNNHSYSNSTSKHQSITRSATTHYKQLYIDIPLWNNNSLVLGQNDFNTVIVSHNEKLAADYLVKASRAKKNTDHYKSMAFKHLNSLVEYAALLGLEYQTGDLSALQAEAIEADKKRKAAEKIRKAEKIKEQAEALEKWRNGENVYNHFEVTALRIKDNEIQTTRGARIPVEHAIKAWPLLKRIHDSGIDYYANGHSIHLGHYTVTSLQNETLTVGCHKIPYSEVLNIANQLQLT